MSLCHFWYHQNSFYNGASNIAYNRAYNSVYNNAYNIAYNTAYNRADNSAYNRACNSAYNRAYNSAYNSGWQAWLAWLASRSPLDDLWRPSSLKQGVTSHTFNQIQFWPFGVVVWPPDDL